MCRAHAVHIFHQCICHDSFEFHRAHKHTLYNTHMYHRFCQLMKLKFSKMTTDGAKRPKISMASLHLKEGKIWRTMSTGARQKDKDIDQVNWKQNALWMLPMHLQLLEVYNSNRFVHWHLHNVLWVLCLESTTSEFNALVSFWALYAATRTLWCKIIVVRKPSHNF